MKDTKEVKAPEKVEVKNVKHQFTAEERSDIGGSLARQIGEHRSIESEFDQVKASFKSRIAECDARIDRLSTDLVNGFTMRDSQCAVVFFPKEGNKAYYLMEVWENHNGSLDTMGSPVARETMTEGDFQWELIQAESKFDCREEISLFPTVPPDYGVLVVGRLAEDKWFAALRVQVGRFRLDERLNGEQRCFKLRADAVSHTIKRVSEWADEKLKKEAAAGFKEGFKKVESAQKERVE